MTPFFCGLLVGTILGAIAFGIFALLLLAHRRPTAPTFHHRRQWRDLPIRETVPDWEREPVEPIYMYGVTGHESD